MPDNEVEVSSGVTASAEITAESDNVGDDMDGDDIGGDDSGMDDGDDEDGCGSSFEGFGPVAGAAGLSGLAAYAYRKLGLDSERATPENDNLDGDDE